MPFAGVAAASVFLSALVLWAPALCHAAGNHNITAILAASPYPYFAQLTAALMSTGLAAEIDNRTTITVLAVDDAVMAPLLARRLPQGSLHHVLAMHVLLDYFNDAKLHSLAGGSATSTSLFQASGDAPGSSGLVNITLRKDCRVAFAPYGAADVPPAVFYQRSVLEFPYDIAVLQVSALISSPAAEAPALAPPALGPGPGTGPAPAPVPAPTPAPACHPAPPPKGAEAPAPAPYVEEPPADEGGHKKNGASGTTVSWSLVAAATAAAMPAIVLVLW